MYIGIVPKCLYTLHNSSLDIGVYTEHAFDFSMQILNTHSFYSDM